MRLPTKLNARLSMLLLAFGLVLIGANWWRNSHWIKERRIIRFESEIKEMGVRLSGMMQHFFRRGLVSSAELEMSYAATTPSLELGLVSGADEKVRFATHLQWTGVNFQDSPLRDVIGVIQEVRSSMTPMVEIDAGLGQVTGVFPFYEQYQSKDRGVVVLRFDMTDALRQAERDAVWESAAQACALLALCLILWLVLDVLVTRRVQQLASYAHAVGGGGDGNQDGVAQDELAVVAQSFAEAVKNLRASESRLVEAAEAERRRIGADLHDDVCQRMSAVQLKSGVLESVLKREGHPQAVLAGAVADELAKATVVVRGFSQGLAPMLVQKGRLAEALHNLATTLAGAFALRCECSCSLGEAVLGVWVDTHIYRIAQELATNAAKHAKPTLIEISVKVLNGVLNIEVINDGEPYTPRQGTGIGLELVAQRVRALGGQWQIVPRDARCGGALACCTVTLGDRHYSDKESSHS